MKEGRGVSWWRENINVKGDVSVFVGGREAASLDGMTEDAERPNNETAEYCCQGGVEVAQRTKL